MLLDQIVQGGKVEERTEGRKVGREGGGRRRRDKMMDDLDRSHGETETTRVLFWV